MTYFQIPQVTSGVQPLRWQDSIIHRQQAAIYSLIFGHGPCCSLAMDHIFLHEFSLDFTSTCYYLDVHVVTRQSKSTINIESKLSCSLRVAGGASGNWAAEQGLQGNRHQPQAAQTCLGDVGSIIYQWWLICSCKYLELPATSWFKAHWEMVPQAVPLWCGFFARGSVISGLLG